MNVANLKDILDECDGNFPVVVDDCGALLKIVSIKIDKGIVRVLQSQECYYE